MDIYIQEIIHILDVLHELLHTCIPLQPPPDQEMTHSFHSRRFLHALAQSLSLLMKVLFCFYPCRLVLLTLDLHEWQHTVCALLCVGSSTPHVLRLAPVCREWMESSFIFHCSVVFHCMNMLHVVNHSVDRYLGCFQFLRPSAFNTTISLLIDEGSWLTCHSREGT